MNANEVIERLESMRNERNRQGMGRYGINVERALGISVKELRKVAREIGTDHALAVALWRTGIHEARLLAGLVADPAEVTEIFAEQWVADFDSWDICDLVCNNCLRRTRFAWKKARQWARRKKEFVRRAGFSLMASLAVHDKAAPDTRFESLYPLVEKAVTDDRNLVKKAVNWALRQIGKRNRALHRSAVALAERIGRLDSRSARWIARDALRELRSEKTLSRIKS